MADYGWTVEELLGAIVFGPDHGDSAEGMAWTARKLRVAAEFLEYRSANARKAEREQLGGELTGSGTAAATQQAPAKRKRKHRATRANGAAGHEPSPAPPTPGPEMFPAEGAVE